MLIKLHLCTGAQFYAVSVYLIQEIRVMGKYSHVGYRSSESGRFVTEKKAETAPSKYQREHIPNPGRGDAPPSNGKKK